MAANVKRKQTIVLSLCKHLSLDPKPFLGDVAEPEIDVNTLCSQIFKSSGTLLQKNNDQVLKWIAFVESFPTDSKACLDSLNELNADLGHKTVILGSGLTPSEADVIVFSALHPSVIGLSISDKEKFPHLMRWMDYIRNKEGLDEFFEKILLEKLDFEPQLQGEKSTAKEEVYPNVRNTIKNTKSADKSEADPNIKKSDAGKKAIGDEVAVQDKKKLPVAEAVDKDKEVSISLLNIQVGLICKAWKHPSADSLLVEEIDVGEAKLRQVVSGLAKYCSPDQLTNRHVVLITNVKPGKLRDVMSEGLVLCASNEDHSVVEPLLPPEGAKLGERISFSGIDGRPEDILNPKKKQLEKITPHLFTDDKGVAMFKGIPFMTSAGPCTSSIPRASIK